MRKPLLPAAVLLTGAAVAQTALQPEVVIRSAAHEVLLEVAVRDAHGRLVTNLRPEEVAVYEDGLLQPVRSFRLVAGSEVRRGDQMQAETAAAAPAPAPHRARPAVNPLRAVNLVCLILNDLTPETRALAFESARKFVDTELRPNTFIGVFSLDSTGLRPVFPFSNNRDRLVHAVELAAVNQLPSVRLGTAALLNGLGTGPLAAVVSGGSATGNADGSSPMHPLGTRGEMGYSTNGGLREIDSLLALVRQLSPLPFQKTVLLLSTGLTRPAELLEYWDLLVHSANKGGVTFYGLDVNGLCFDIYCRTSPVDTSRGLLQAAAALSKQQAKPPAPSMYTTAPLMEAAHEDDYVKFAVSSGNRQEALRELAERTGGFLIAYTNNADKLIARVMEDVDTHYEIAYPPSSDNYDGHFRKIEVKLTRPGLTVQTRSGYFAVPETGQGPVTPEEMAALRALDTQPRPRALDFRLRAYRFRDSGATAQYAIAFEMPISNLTAAAGNEPGKHLLHASLLALVKDAEGQIVDRVSKDVPSEVSDDHLTRVQAEIMTYAHAVSLPPGRYTVDAAVVDQEGNRAGTKSVQIDNQERKGLALSELTLVRRLEPLSRPPDAADPFELAGRRVLPFVTTDLLPGAIPVVYYVVYPDKDNAARPQLRVQLFRDGRLVQRQNSPLPAPDEAGAIPMVTKASESPGSYEMRITVAQGNQSVQGMLQYTLGHSRVPVR